MEVLHNGGGGAGYRWGQTIEEVVVHYADLPDGVRARDLSVVISRRKLRVELKGGALLLDGALAQPVLCDESTWMVEDGVLVLQLAKDNRRAENVGPISEWWHGLFEGEESLDKSAVSVEDYIRSDQLPPEQRVELSETRARREAAEAKLAAERRLTAESEAALPASQQNALASLRASFPDIPIEYGDSSSPVGAAPL